MFRQTVCPACRKAVIFLFLRARGQDKNERLIKPKAINRAPLSPHVTEKIADDYNEACLVLPDGPKASAALSRRCLQQLLEEKAQVKKGDLAKQIDQVLKSNQLPSDLAESLDAVRNIGNFAAHPNKYLTTGEIVDVEPGEAEWNLEVLEALFDFYFDRPAKLKARKDALNAKLQASGKPPIKS